MAEREGEVRTDVVVPQSIDQLFGVLYRSMQSGQTGFSIEESVSPQEFEWMAQAILQECMQLEDDQIRSIARALTQQAHISPHYPKASVTRVGDFLSGLAQLLTVHPATILEGDEREEVLVTAHGYHKKITTGYEIVRPDYDAAEANAAFVRRVVGAVAIHLEQLEIPYFLQEEEVEASSGNMLIGVAALRGARYISSSQYRRLTNRILTSQQVSKDAKPADVLFVPPGWQNNL